MRANIIRLVTFLALVCPSGAGTVHTIQVIDTNAENIGTAVGVSGAGIDTLLREALPARGVTLVPRILNGPAVTPAGVFDAVRSLSIGPDDVVFFYYAGHGAVDQGSREHVLTTSGGVIVRSQLRQELMARGARLVLMITDCCSNLAPWLQGPIGQGAPRALCGGSGPGEVLYQLLENHQGLVDITGAQEGTYSWFSTGEIGGFFTRAFVSTVRRSVGDFDQNQDGRVSWEEFFPSVSSTTSLIFQQQKAAAPAHEMIRQSADQRPWAMTLATWRESSMPTAPVSQGYREYRRIPYVRNLTAEPVTVMLKYYTLTTDGWQWFPNWGHDQLNYTFAAGAEGTLAHESWIVNAYEIKVTVVGQTTGREYMRVAGPIVKPEGYQDTAMQSYILDIR